MSSDTTAILPGEYTIRAEREPDTGVWMVAVRGKSLEAYFTDDEATTELLAIQRFQDGAEYRALEPDKRTFVDRLAQALAYAILHAVTENMAARAATPLGGTR